MELSPEIVGAFEDVFSSEPTTQEPTMLPVVGELRFQQAGQDHRACLCQNMRWACDDKEIEQYLNATCVIDLPGDVDRHRCVIHGLYQTAERLGAEVTVEPR